MIPCNNFNGIIIRLYKHTPKFIQVTGVQQIKKKNFARGPLKSSTAPFFYYTSRGVDLFVSLYNTVARDPLELFMVGRLCLKPLLDTEVILHSERGKTDCKNKRNRGGSEKENFRLKLLLRCRVERL